MVNIRSGMVVAETRKTFHECAFPRAIAAFKPHAEHGNSSTAFYLKRRVHSLRHSWGVAGPFQPYVAHVEKEGLKGASSVTVILTF